MRRLLGAPGIQNTGVLGQSVRRRGIPSRRRVDIMEITLSSCRNGLVWRKLLFVGWLLVDSQAVDVYLDKAAMN